MKYIVKTMETESYVYEYMVEAESGDEAKEKVLGPDWTGVKNIDSDYLETFDREILEIEPYNEDI